MMRLERTGRRVLIATGVLLVVAIAIKVLRLF